MKLARLAVVFLSTLLFASGMPGCAPRGGYVKVPPPPPRGEVRPSKPFNNAVWISGHWEWTGNQYSWKSGQWIKPPKGKGSGSGYKANSSGSKKWVSGHWKKTPGGYVWVDGHWN
jgi:WXXGXW repeat (2 copies)